MGRYLLARSLQHRRAIGDFDPKLAEGPDDKRVVRPDHARRAEFLDDRRAAHLKSNGKR
jgi:hypothetical protein